MSQAQEVVSQALPATPAAALEEGLRHHRAGDLGRAEALYREVLRVQPEHADALHLLGVVAHQVGRRELAVKLIGRAIQIDRGQARYYNALGMGLAALGRPGEATAAYRRALELAPGMGEAHNNLGNVLLKQGRLEEALACYERALAADAGIAEAHNNLGNVLKRSGRVAQALESYRRAIALRPEYAEAYGNLGEALEALGRVEEAIACYRKAISLKPGYAEACSSLGNALNRLGRLEEAVAAYERAIELRPDQAAFHNNLAVALGGLRQLERAIACYQRGIALQPDYADAYGNLGVALKDAGRLEEAEAACRRAIAISPGNAEAHNNLGNVLKEREDQEPAIECYRRAIALKPGLADAWNNLGNSLKKQGRLDETVAAYGQALALKPDLAAAWWNRSLARLTAGDYAQGWKEYEWRWEGCPPLRGGNPALPPPPWRGEDLSGRRLLVQAEQGLGDEIMFASILPEIVREAGSCLIECSPKLEKLYRRSFPGAVVFGNDRTVAGWEQRLGDWLAGQPAADVRTPIGSLALYRRRGLQEFPRHRGYLKADAQRVRTWKARLGKLGPGLKVGLSWRGGRAATGRVRRSLELEHLVPLLRRRGLRFVSLQYGEGAEELGRVREASGVEVAHWPEAIEDYDETAALVKALDLVLSVCTAVIHLGGALGQRTWVLVPHVPEWRYGMQGEATPWYPSVRLFRQPSPGNWDSVLARVARELPGLRS